MDHYALFWIFINSLFTYTHTLWQNLYIYTHTFFYSVSQLSGQTVFCCCVYKLRYAQILKQAFFLQTSYCSSSILPLNLDQITLFSSAESKTYIYFVGTFLILYCMSDGSLGSLHRWRSQRIAKCWSCELQDTLALFGLRNTLLTERLYRLAD